jgi:hypothetical protein
MDLLLQINQFNCYKNFILILKIKSHFQKLKKQKNVL